MEQEVIRLIEASGPLTGSEVWENIGGDSLSLWRTCRHSSHLMIHTVGMRYLRLDRRVEGFARLSPSILREFLTYSIVGLAGDAESAEARARAVSRHIEEVSRSKLELVYQVSSVLSNQFEREWLLDHKVCFIIAGDIVYNMAHDVPRPERSTGKLVNGSDMDLVVVVDDGCPEALRKRLDESIYQEKYRLLITPHIREEIDYVVKDLEKVRKQVQFDSFKHMVACKILHEGTFLFGSESLFKTVKDMLRQSGVSQKLEDMEKRAKLFRRDAEEVLLREDPEKLRRDGLSLFYPTEESEEFE